MSEASRRLARTRPRGDLHALVDRTVAVAAPWLPSPGASPPRRAGEALSTVSGTLSREARTSDEAAIFAARLHALVDDWNARHPEAELAPLPAIAVIPAQPPAWGVGGLVDLDWASRWAEDVTAARAAVEAGAVVGASTLAALAMASAVLDAACLARGDLRRLARHLADPTAPIQACWSGAVVAPPWIDLHHRAPASRSAGRGSERGPSTVSGVDARGPYALRRLFLPTATLQAIRRLDLAGDGHGLLRRAARSDAAMGALLAQATPSRGPRDGRAAAIPLRRLLRGALLLLEARGRDAPDHATAQLAAGRMEAYAATPESWAVALNGPATVGPLPREGGSRPDIAAEHLVGGEADWPRGGEDAGERRVERRPVPEASAFRLLHAALQPPLAEADLTSEGGKLTRGALMRRLRALDAAGASDCVRLLRDWYLHLCEVERLAPNSVRRYHSTLGAPFCAVVGHASLRGLDPDDVEDLVEAVMGAEARSPAERRNLRRRLRMLLRFGADHPGWGLPEPEEALFAPGRHGAGDVEEDAPTRVRAVALARPEVDAVRALARTGLGLPPEVARAVDAVVLVMSRAGLRLGEACKTALGHMEDVPAAHLREARLFVRPSRFGDNKTRSAYRQIPVFALLRDDEREDLAAYLVWRRTRGGGRDGPLFGVPRPDGSMASFARGGLGALISEALRRVSGLPPGPDAPSSHTLRRHAATNLHLCLAEARGDLRAPMLLDRLTGWDACMRAAAAATVAPASLRRDAWAALARLLGHAGPATTFSTYAYAADLAIFGACATGGRDWGTDADDVRRLLDAMPARRPAPSPEPGPAGPRPQPTAAPLPGIEGAVASPAAALLETLEAIDRGAAPGPAAAAAFLHADHVAARLPVARAWSALRTRRGSPRLQPSGRAGLLAPAPLRGARRAEALDLADTLIAIMRGKADGLTPDAARRWIVDCLEDATLDNAGRRLHTPDAFAAWLPVALALRPAGRWHLEQIVPKGAEPDRLRAWARVRPPAMLGQRREIAGGAAVVVRARLLAPSTVAKDGRRAPAASYAGAVRFACNLVAVECGIEPSSNEPSSQGR